MGLLWGAVKKFFKNIPGNVVTLYFVGSSFVLGGRLFYSLVVAAETIPSSVELLILLIVQEAIKTVFPVHRLVFTSFKAFLISVGFILGFAVVKVLIGSFIWSKRWYYGMKEAV